MYIHDVALIDYMPEANIGTDHHWNKYPSDTLKTPKRYPLNHPKDTHWIPHIHLKLFTDSTITFQFFPDSLDDIRTEIQRGLA